jgi:hypothetical protein
LLLLWVAVNQGRSFKALFLISEQLIQLYGAFSVLDRALQNNTAVTENGPKEFGERVTYAFHNIAVILERMERATFEDRLGASREQILKVLSEMRATLSGIDGTMVRIDLKTR